MRTDAEKGAAAHVYGGHGDEGGRDVVFTFSYMTWQAAQIECELALGAWHAAMPGRTALAHVAYRAALDREEAAARDLEELCRLAALATRDARAHAR